MHAKVASDGEEADVRIVLPHSGQDDPGSGQRQVQQRIDNPDPARTEEGVSIVVGQAHGLAIALWVCPRHDLTQSCGRNRYCGGNWSRPLMVAFKLFQRPSLIP
ncbi:hypothetical protein D3C77_707570 [compost metagenome]